MASLDYRRITTIVRSALTLHHKSKGTQVDKKFGFKDWASLVISCLALGVASLTVYFNIVRQLDELRVAVDLSGRGISIDTIRAKKGFRLSGAQTFTFINSGNRPISVSGVEAVLVQPDRRFPTNPDQCEGGERRGFHFALAPFVVKAGDIVVTQASIAPPEPGAMFSEVGASEDNEKSGTYEMLVCVSFNLIAVDGTRAGAARPLYSLRMLRFDDPNKLDFPARSFKGFDKPLLSRSGTIFGMPNLR